MFRSSLIFGIILLDGWTLAKNITSFAEIIIWTDMKQCAIDLSCRRNGHIIIFQKY